MNAFLFRGLKPDLRGACVEIAKLRPYTTNDPLQWRLTDLWTCSSGTAGVLACIRHN